MTRVRATTLGLGWSAALLLGFLVPGDGPEVRWMVLMAIVVLGTPHGALDALLLLRGGQGQAWRRTLSYLLLSLATALLFWLAPLLCVPAFFVLAAWHFGEGEGAVSAGRQTDWAAGFLPLLAPFAFHPGETASLVGNLFLGPVPEGFATTSQFVGTLGVVLAALAVLWRRRESIPEVASTLVWFAWLPPLSAFAIWYLAIHSGRHMVRLADALGEPRAVSLLGAAGAIAGALLVWFLGTQPAVRDAVAEPAAFQTSIAVVFIALGALTVPHAILVSRSLGRDVC